MNRKKRKIGFYYLVLSNERVVGLIIKDELEKLFNFINSLGRQSKMVQLRPDKFCLLSTVNNDGDIRELVFESAIHDYRAPLLDRRTASTRENPKTMNEGETMKTHLVLKYIDGEVLVIAEKFRGGLSMKEILGYLKKMKQQLEASSNIELAYSFEIQTIAKDNIQEELNAMTRVISAELYVDKQVIGSEALNYSDRISTVKEEIVITVRSKRLEDLRNTAQDFWNKFSGRQTEIKKLRIEGKNRNNNPVMIDTSFMEKRETVDAFFHSETGVVDTVALLANMRVVINTP